MANYRAVSGGNWSDLARWEDDSGGSYAASSALPGVNDVVYSNGNVVTLDMDISVTSLRSTSTTNVAVGGRFVYGTGCTTVIANVYGSGLSAQTTGFTLDCPAADTRYLIGNSYGGNIPNATCVAVRMSGSGSLIQTGDAYGGNNANAAGVACGTLVTSAGNYTLNGNAYGSVISGATFGEAISSIGGGNVVINGSSVRNNSAGFRQFNLAGTAYVHTVVNSGIAINGITISTGTCVITNCQYALSTIRFTSDGSILTHLENGNPITFTAAPNYPDETDVREGILYGPANMYEGNLEAGITAVELFDAIENSSHPIAQRLRTVSTEGTTAAQIASAVT